ncbi:MAG: hypothetical protein PWP34_2071 [Desulfuromonadales bacterium]|jgi:hypothetical protein|nr:hypothetical protein [Desulfuromonadales bacterium]
MKKCPFCAEDIQDAAIKCKHCGEFLQVSKNPRLAAAALPWYFRTSTIVIALGCVGPLALPLIWWRPKLAPGWKIGLTIGILLLSWVFYLITVESFRAIQEYYEFLNSL